MSTPLLIDTDMGIDDAAALILALGAPSIDVRAVLSVGGRSSAEQAAQRVMRIFNSLGFRKPPPIGLGFNPTGRSLNSDVEPSDRAWMDWGDQGASIDVPPLDGQSMLRSAIETANGTLCVLCLGPLTNMARLLEDDRELAGRIHHVFVCGGAVWTRGDVTPTAEISFHADPQSAARVLSSGLPITVAPLDVSRLINLDESHVAHVAASGQAGGELLARLLRSQLANDSDAGHGKCHIHGAVGAASVIWPELFLKTRMRLEIVTQGVEAGRSKPALGGEKADQIGLLTAVNATDILENMLETICREEFVV